MDRRPSHEVLTRIFRIDVETGRLFWRENRQRPDLIGKEAGFIDNCGYVRVAIRGRKYLRSHLVFRMVMGRWPAQKIDHINRIRTDDRPDNLREATHAENMWNRTPKRRDLPMGVTRRERRYSAEIMRNGQLYRLGRFDTVAEAQDAYQNARKELFGEYA
jgi:hypothetical protein